MVNQGRLSGLGAYRPEIDALRGIAVLLVVLYHADLFFPGGYVGVDIFFVISGFLISGGIVRELERGSFSLIAFWDSRIRRIQPALCVMTLATLLFGWAIMLPTDVVALANSSLAQTAMLANLWFWKTGGYFESAAELQPLLHTWSLAVEEQFYLVFPLLLVALSKGACHHYRLIIFIALCVVSFLVSVYGTFNHPSATYFLLPARAWELGLGSVLALIPVDSCKSLPTSAKEALSVVGLGLIGSSSLLFSEKTLFPGAGALLPCFGTALFIYCNGAGVTEVGRLLSVKPLLFVGIISYSLYLWHWPTLVFAKYWIVEGASLSIRLTAVAVSVILAVVSWRYVESPFRTPRWIRTVPSRVVFFGFGGSFLLGGVVSIGLKHAPVPFWLSGDALSFALASKKYTNLQVDVDDANKGKFGKIGFQGGSSADFLLWGDSHAMSIIPCLDKLGFDHGLTGIVATHSITPPILDFIYFDRAGLDSDTPAFANAVVEFVRKNSIRHVILAGIWSAYHEASMDSRTLGEFNGSLRRTIDELQSCGASVSIMLEVPRQRTPQLPKLLARQAILHDDIDSVGVTLTEHRGRLDAVNSDIAQLAALGVQVLDPSPLFFVNGDTCRVRIGDQCFFSDAQHLTPTCAMQLRGLFEPIIECIRSSKDVRADSEDAFPK